jgi:hypothetical protein
MRHVHENKGQVSTQSESKNHNMVPYSRDFVLEKVIFNNVFEKDIRRVFIYKKAERLAKAIHIITPAFVQTESLKDRMDAIAVGLVDAAVLPPAIARTELSRQLLALSSILSIAQTGGLLSLMNAELIAREAHTLLEEVAAYEEPRLSLEETPSLAALLKQTAHPQTLVKQPKASSTPKPQKRQIKDVVEHVKDRQEAILSVIRQKESASIKDISTVIRNVSEKTIQRELLVLISRGLVSKQGERRWSTYSLS